VKSDVLRDNETIVAVASAPGRGAIALIRLSGANAFQIGAQHVRPWPTDVRTAAHCRIFDGDVELDDAIVTLFFSPHSFTGEDVVEISTHGGQLAPASVVRALVQSGAIPALPGEFTRRAIFNGKLDLIQAEGIGELVNAKSTGMQRAAIFQLHGGLTRKLTELRERFLELEALIAYDIDFPGEDDGPVKAGTITKAATELETALAELLSTVSFGRIIRDGATVVIAGPPNAGKSSLFNAMLGISRAIVTEIPGTTRDALEAVIDTGHWALRLVDTAGLRPTYDTIEKLGIEVSERYLAAADIALACGESLAALDETEAALANLTEAPVLRVWTKADMRAAKPTIPEKKNGEIEVSAERRTGLDQLFAEISATLAENYGSRSAADPILTTARQQAAIRSALNELRRFQEVRVADEVPATIAAVHLRSATTALEELIGAVDVEDVLTKLFSTFCVGK
jgi:tRNA modification GTPase